MNKRSVQAMQQLGWNGQSKPNSFDGYDYARFQRILSELRDRSAFESMGQVDRFLYFVSRKIDSGEL